MSREEVIGENLTIAFGVDTITGAFAQLWTNPADEQDAPLIRIDSNGIDIIIEAEPAFPPPLKRFVADLVERYRVFEAKNPGDRPNIGEQDVIALARAAGGFPEIAMDVYRVFGDDI